MTKEEEIAGLHRMARFVGHKMRREHRAGYVHLAKHLMCDVIWYRQKATELRRAS